MRRRHLLAAVGTCLPLAGCVGTGFPDESPSGQATTPDEPTTTGATTRGATPPSNEETASSAETTPATADPETLALGESFETPDGATVAVRDVRVQRAVFALGSHVDPYFESGEQFVVVDAAVSDADLRDGFSVVADGRTVSAETHVALAAPFRDLTDRRRALQVPAPLDAERVAVVWSGPDGARARWPLDADDRRALANPPRFSVEGFEVPESVKYGSSFTATVTVANSGSGDGTFRAELGATTISDTPEVRIEVPAGETVTAERTVEPHYPGERDELTVRLNWGANDLERTVTVV